MSGNRTGFLDCLKAGCAAAVLASSTLGSVAVADIVLTPTTAGVIGANLGPSNCEVQCIYDVFNLSSTPPLTLLYKDNVGGSEEGTFATSYQTTYSNDNHNALIDYISGSSIECPECYLAIKDGNQTPSYYFYNLAAWNGTENIVLTGFWANTQGSISHISIWGRDDSRDPPIEIPEPSVLALLGLGLAAAGVAGRRKRS